MNKKLFLAAQAFRGGRGGTGTVSGNFFQGDH